MNDPMPAIHSILSPEAIEDHIAADFVRQRTSLAERIDQIAPPELKPERVDIAPPGRRHAEDAERLLGDAREMVDGGDYYPTPTLSAVMSVAEATLALAEQQRIANVIAWQALTGESNRQEIRRDLFG